jgi:hypothetical protein
MTRRALASLVIVGLVAALVVLAQRARLEARYRAVEIVLDGDDWLMLITREGRDPGEVLAALRERGATSMALSDPTLKRLADNGTISYASGASLASMSRLGLHHRHIRHARVRRGPPADVAGRRPRQAA